MELAIKNMVCDRCIETVRVQFEALGYHPTEVQLGTVQLQEDIDELDLKGIATRLESVGFQLLATREERMVQEVKAHIQNLVRSGQLASIGVNLSNHLAKAIGISYSVLSRNFSAIERQTLENYYIKQRVEQAKEWLSYNELSITEIADKLGYSSNAYFSNQFKHLTGQTPGQYRSTPNEPRNGLDTL